ncbi:taurine dioxygenase [uncultured Thiothrix sp.]|uniref:taurine dioxygenase n=1 Tax=uncultured Thiothrix sp. TaxID=223185 RepID=UPI0026185539|nr:taurine dioxygenase [uncultured Thiothrix sp.]
MASFKRLTPALGAEVQGLDLAKPLSTTEQAQLSEALVEHQVLFLRNQVLEPTQQRDLALRFGDLHIHPIYPKTPQAPEVLILDNYETDVTDNAIWHTDVTFIQTPPAICVLSAKLVPEVGGDTLWSSAFAAWEGLSPRLQTLLEGLTATHDFVHSFPQDRYGNTPETHEQWLIARDKNPPVTHPVVRTHPVNGRKALFVNENFTTKINELPRLESQALLRFLFEHVGRPEFTVRWHWQPNDLVLWDNRSTQHYATNDYGKAHRVMQRATVLGDKPV